MAKYLFVANKNRAKVAKQASLCLELFLAEGLICDSVSSLSTKVTPPASLQVYQKYHYNNISSLFIVALKGSSTVFAWKMSVLS